jgi:hypothetical protein
LSLAADHRSDLVGLKFRSREILDFSVIEPTAPYGRSFQLTMSCIPGNSFDPSDGGLVQTFDTEGGNFIKRGAAVLKSMIRSTGWQAEGLPANPTQVATTLPPPGLVEAVADDLTNSSLSRQRTLPVWTTETLHRWWTLWAGELMARN